MMMMMGFPWNFVTALGLKKTGKIKTSKNVTIHPFVWDTVPALDRRTGRQTELVKQYRIALHADAR